MDREPCPWRVVDDAGGAFGFGLVTGAIWNFVGGARNAPRGHRLSQAVTRMRARTPILGGSFAIWGTLFSCFDCSFTYIRKKEDPWNAIMSGAATGGVLAARAGLKAAGKNAVIGGIILAAIEGLNIVVTRVMMPYIEKQQADAGRPIDMLDPPLDPLRPYQKSQPLWQPSAPSSPLLGFPGSGQLHTTAPSGGFDIDSIPAFDITSSSTPPSNPDPNAHSESKPFWRVW